MCVVLVEVLDPFLVQDIEVEVLVVEILVQVEAEVLVQGHSANHDNDAHIHANVDPFTPGENAKETRERPPVLKSWTFRRPRIWGQLVSKSWTL